MCALVLGGQSLRDCGSALAGFRALALALALAIPSAACRSPSGRAGERQDDGPAKPAVQPIELVTRWDGREESDAINALMREHHRRHPRDEIILGSSTSAFSALEGKAIRKRIFAGEAPDVFHSNVGKNHMQWVKPNGVDDSEAMVVALDGVLEDVAEWRKTMPANLLEYVSFDHKLYGVPANIHRLNLLYYNRRVFAEHGLRPPTSIDDLKSAGAKLAAAGIPLLALGSKEEWPLALLVFECILVAKEGPGYYRDYFSGRRKPNDPGIVRALKTASDLLRFVNKDAGQLSWLQAALLVDEGKAAATAIGDWASVVFEPGGLRSDSEIVEIPFPGSERSFVFTSDVFSVAVGAKNPAGARRLVATIGSVGAQQAINRAKGSLPARMDAIWDGLDGLRARKRADLQSADLVMALSGMVPAQFYADTTGALVGMMADGDVDAVVHVLTSRYALLRVR